MRIGIIAGEASGDQLGAGLIRALSTLAPQATFEGVAGPAMEAAGCEVLENSEALALFGLIEPLRHIPRLLRLRKSLVQRWTANPPDVFVGIDAPDFNLGLEIKLRARGIRTVQYVSPSVWAWRQRRVRKVARAVDRVLCLLPFEKAFYDEHDVSAEFVGHPLADRMQTVPDVSAARRAAGFDARRLVAVLPGSRGGEVSRLGPVFADACQLLANEDADVRFVAPMANAELHEMFRQQVDAKGVAERFTLLEGRSAEAMAAADVVLLASGTAALEAALIGRPMVAAYRLAPLTYAIARMLNLVKVSHFTLPNLLTPEPMVEEFVQNDASPENLAGAVSGLLGDNARRRRVSSVFLDLYRELKQGADINAARAVLSVARGQ